MFVYDFYWDMIRREIRGPELFVPFVLGVGVIGAVAGLLCWQLSRLITVARRPEDWAAKQERPAFREVQPQGRFVPPTDPHRGAVEPPSVVEQTTRQMAPAKLDID
jgi:hypothetical protein